MSETPSHDVEEVVLWTNTADGNSHTLAFRDGAMTFTIVKPDGTRLSMKPSRTVYLSKNGRWHSPVSVRSGIRTKVAKGWMVPDIKQSDVLRLPEKKRYGSWITRNLLIKTSAMQRTVSPIGSELLCESRLDAFSHS